MRPLVLGWFRRKSQASHPRGAKPVEAAASTGLEPLEPRVLLSGVGLGGLPNMVDVGNALGPLTSTFSINLPEMVTERSGPSVAGSVFADTDGDTLRDPFEYALEGVRVFADLDGDGALGGAEPSSVTGTNGRFYLNNLPAGDYRVRVLLPDGYKASQDGSASASVTVTDTTGVGGLGFAIAKSGYDLGIKLSDVSLPDKFKTGTRLTVPVIVTNLGDTPLSAGGIKLRVFASGDATRSRDDVRLTKVALKEDLLPGQSIKLNLDVALLSAAADFQSYLIVDAVGKGLRGDIDRENNIAVSDVRLNFAVTDRPTYLGLSDLNIVLGNWNTAIPFGGVTPGLGFNDGFVGISDLNIILGNWNAGAPSGGTSTTVWNLDLNTGVVVVQGEDGPGELGSLSGAVVHDPSDRLEGSLGWLWPGYTGLAGWTVYLDNNNNGVRNADERWTLTSEDGSYSFTDLPTYLNASASRSYTVAVEVPNGWERWRGQSDWFPINVPSGEDVVDINFGFYAPPQLGGIEVQGGYLTEGLPTRITAQDVVDLDGSIERVLFYYDRDSDSVADDLLGVDSDGSDGYSIVADRIGSGAFNGSSGTVIAIAQDNDGNLRGGNQFAESRLGIEVSKGKRLVYREADGTVVTVSMAGPGSARVLLSGTGVRAWDLGGVVELTGGARVDTIQLEQTTAKSKLMIRTTGDRGQGRVASIRGSITGSTPLGALAAGKIEINGGVRMTGEGTIRKLRAANLSRIVMEGTAFNGGVDIRVGRASGEARIASPVRLLKAGSLTNFNLEAPWADQITVRDNYTGGSIRLTDPEVRFNLMQLKVGKVLQGVDVRAASSIHTVAAETMLRSRVVAGGSTSGLLGTAVASGNATQRGAIVNLTVGGAFTDSFLSAWRIGKVKLDSAGQDNPNELFGLVYHRLRRYQGPAGVDQTVV